MEEKVVLGARVDKKVVKAVDEAKWLLKMSKGKVVKEAIKEYLKKHCPEVYEEFLKELESEQGRERD